MVMTAFPEAITPDYESFSPHFRNIGYDRYDVRLFMAAAANLPNVDVEPLKEALPAPGVVQDAADSADALAAVHEVLRRAGIPDGFTSIYLPVTRRCDDVYVQNEAGRSYGTFRAPEALNHTVPIFAEFDLDAYRAYVWAVDAIKAGYAGPEAFAAIPPHWRPVLLDPYLRERASRAEEFIPGMIGHIGADLPYALLKSDPPEAYRADFFGTVSQILYDVAYEHTPELVNGNTEMFRAILPLIMHYILNMRVDAWRDFHLLQAMTENERYDFAARSSVEVARQNRRIIMLGRLGLGMFRQTNHLPDWMVSGVRPPMQAFEKGLRTILERSVSLHTEGLTPANSLKRSGRLM